MVKMTLKLPILDTCVSLFDISHGIAIDLKIKIAVYIKVFPGQGAFTLLEQFVPLSYN